MIVRGCFQMNEPLQNRTLPSLSISRSDNGITDETITVPLIEEQLTVEKRVIETGKIRLLKSVQTYEELLDESLAVRSFDIERVIVNQPVEIPPPIRQEGDTTIYSLVEERMVLTKQFILTEEIRVTQRDTERRDRRKLVLSREYLAVEREASGEK